MNLLDLFEDVLLELPDAISERAPWPLKSVVHLVVLIVTGTIFSAILLLAAVVGLVTSPVWVPVVLFHIIKELRRE